MSNAQFCVVCGEVISDGCVDDDGHTSYTPCVCETGIDSNNRIVDATKAARYLGVQDPPMPTHPDARSAPRPPQPGMVERVAQMVWDRNVDFEHTCSWEEAQNIHDLRLVIAHLFTLSEGYITAVLDAIAHDYAHSVVTHIGEWNARIDPMTNWEETVPEWMERMRREVMG